MRRALQHIEVRQAELGAHPFFRRLAEDLPLAQVVLFVPQVSFFVLAFQDLMKMTGERASDPRLRDLLRRHCEEEIGHEKWFLRDVVRLAGAVPELPVLFGAQHAPTRLATYALAAEALGARDDVERLCLIFTLEAAGDLCFGAAQAYFERAGVVDGLVYFAGVHREIEASHSVFEAGVQAVVEGLELDAEGRARACAAVDRMFDAFRGMLDGLASTLAVGVAI
jgi:hypothetical protein